MAAARCGFRERVFSVRKCLLALLLDFLPDSQSEFLLTSFWRDSGETMRIFVGNLSYQTTEDQLSDLFSQVGEVESATIVTDRDTGRSRGFAFIEMDRDAAQKAIQQFNGYELNGRAINVNEEIGRAHV